MFKKVINYFKKKMPLFFLVIVFISYSYQQIIYAANYHPNLTEEEYIEMLNEAINAVRNNFVDTDKISIEKLYFGAIEGALASLEDPYTRFLPPEKYDDLKMKTTGKFGGLGIIISIKNKVLTIVSPIINTPAYKLGLKPGDQIIEIDDVSTEGITLQEAVEKMRGEPGTQVSITINRPEFQKPKKFTITRAIIKIDSVQSKMIDKEIGYVRLLEFAENSNNELTKAIKDLRSKGMKKLVFDLRNNPGGLLESAYDIANIFLESGMIVYTRGRNPHQNKNYYANKDANDVISEPLIILANEGAASGSEIVVGAIKDNNRGLIVGEKTFGKGLVQSVYPFRRLPQTNAGVAITTAKYYTPSGVCIQDTGIFPDFEIKPQTLSDTEVEGLQKFYQKDYALTFVRKHPVYNEDAFNELLEELKKEGIIIRRELILANIKEQYAREKSEHYFADLDTDEVLRKSITLFDDYEKNMERAKIERKLPKKNNDDAKEKEKSSNKSSRKKR